MRTLFTRKEAAARLNISLVTLDEEQQGGCVYQAVDLQATQFQHMDTRTYEHVAC